MKKQTADRSIPPPISEVGALALPPVHTYQLDNGLEVIDIRMGTQNILKLEICFRAGRPFEKSPLVAMATSSLLREGTSRYSAAEIAETFDYYGGTLSTPVNLDHSIITVYCMERHFESLLPLVQELVTAPTFPEQELEAFVNRRLQRLQIDLSRNDIAAYRAITERIFGSDHPYGYNSNPEMYGQLTRDQLQDHFQTNYTADNALVIISGKTSDRTIRLLNTYLGRDLNRGQRREAKLPNILPAPGKEHIAQPDQLQSAIRIGRQMFNRSHPDFPAMFVLNTVLGGYFGSRLMENIREDKGYTYNIYSMVDPMLYDGYFYVGTEVGSDVAEPALQEIYQELGRLRQELIPQEELQMVRNYLQGNLLTMLDGPFNVADVVRTLRANELDHSLFAQIAETVRSISAEQLRETARKYWSESDLWEIVVG
jgi:zinc protease